MNYIDNGVQEVLYVKRIMLPYKACFEVTFIDYYGQRRTREFTSIDRFYDWRE